LFSINIEKDEKKSEVYLGELYTISTEEKGVKSADVMNSYTFLSIL